MSEQKLNGSYYTPKYIADFISNHLTQNIQLKNEIDILEPSCGDGVFVKSLFECASLSDVATVNLYLVEKDVQELKKAEALVQEYSSKNFNIFQENTDYLEFHFRNKKKFDLIIGNPPYIKRNYLSKTQIELCKKIQSLIGMKNDSISNIWLSFVIGAIHSLKDNGAFCFVLPGEVLQVKYASKLRAYLRKQFKKIEIFTFNELIFDNIEQDVIILFGYKSAIESGIDYYSIPRLEEVAATVDTSKPINHKSINKHDKWTGYVLEGEQLEKVISLGSDLKKMNYYCDSGAGIVTAANNFFIVSKTKMDQYNLGDISLPIIPKSNSVPNCVQYTAKDYEELQAKDAPCKLVLFDKNNADEYDCDKKKYLEIGISKKIDKRFKCTKRKPWYKVTSIWTSEGIFFKRSHLYPKIIYNQPNVLVTDSGYRITMKNDYNIESLIFSFYNSLTLAFCELTGRFYGGGVLELTPNEFKELPIPYLKIGKRNFKKLDNMLRQKKDIYEVLQFTDKIILEEGFGMDRDTVEMLKSVYLKLSMNRLKQLINNAN